MSGTGRGPGLTFAGPQSASLPPGSTSAGCGAPHSDAWRLTQMPSGSLQASESPSGAQVGESKPACWPVMQNASGAGGLPPDSTFPLTVYQTMCVDSL